MNTICPHCKKIINDDEEVRFYAYAENITYKLHVECYKKCWAVTLPLFPLTNEELFQLLLTVSDSNEYSLAYRNRIIEEMNKREQNGNENL